MYLGQRPASGKYVVGPKEGVFRPIIIRRGPVESIWEDNLSLVIGLPWKHSQKHAIREEVMLGAYTPDPSLRPVGAPLPPAMIEETLKDARRFYVKTTDSNLASGGMLFTTGGKGCASIISGKSRFCHDEKRRVRVVGKVSADPLAAARVKATWGS